MAAAWESRFAEWVKKVCGLRESTSLEVLPDLMPTLDVASPDPFLVYCRRERLVCFGLSHTATAGNLPTIHLVNNTPGMLLAIEQLVLTTSATQELMAELTTYAAAGSPAAAAAATREFSDRRLKYTNEEPSTFIAGTSDAASIAATEFLSMMLATNVSIVVPCKVVLTEGTEIRLQGQNAATTLRVTAFGREWTPDVRDMT